MIVKSCFIVLVNFLANNHFDQYGWMMKNQNGETIRTWSTNGDNLTSFIEITPRLPRNNVSNYKYSKCFRDGFEYNVYEYERVIK